MKALLGASTLILGLAAAPPAAAIDLNDGPATVTLDVCGGGNPVQPMYVSNCTYVRFPKRPLNGALESFVYWTDQGKVTWQGTLTGNTLTFPAAGQTWPTLIVGTGSTDQVNPTDISGTIDANGRVDLSWNYSFTLSSNLVCTLSQTVQLSSAGTEASTGAQGSAYDFASRRFALVSTTYPLANRSGDCSVPLQVYDIAAQGLGWYLTGTLDLPASPTPPAPSPPDPTPPDPTQPDPTTAQSADVTLPKKVKSKGTTVLLPAAVIPTGGVPATPRVTWSTRRTAKGTNPRLGRAKISQTGRVTFTPKGNGKRLWVRLTLTAPATTTLDAYRLTKTWRVR